MKFTSIKEYFYRMHTVLYLLVLAPLLFFAFLYIEFNSDSLVPRMPELGQALRIALGAVTVIDWFAAVLVFRASMKEVRKLTNLGEKLGRYATSAYVKFAMLSSGALLLGIGFYLTGDDAFAALFAISLIILSVTWPLPRKVCADLRLKGEERRLVLNKLDTLG